MGLDGVELMMAVEKRFGIEVDEGEGWVFYSTPDDIVWMVREKLAGRSIPEWSNEHAQKLDELLKTADGYEAGGVLKKLFRGSRLENFIPADQRQGIWTQLGQSLGIELPRLETSDDGVVHLPRNVRSKELLHFWLLRHCPDVLDADASQVSVPASGQSGHEADDSGESVFETVQQLICETLGVNADEVQKDSLMVADLVLG